MAEIDDSHQGDGCRAGDDGQQPAEEDRIGVLEKVKIQTGQNVIVVMMNTEYSGHSLDPSEQVKSPDLIQP
jgi:hypothetical protein